MKASFFNLIKYARQTLIIVFFVSFFLLLDSNARPAAEGDIKNYATSQKSGFSYKDKRGDNLTEEVIYATDLEKPKRSLFERIFYRFAEVEKDKLLRLKKYASENGGFSVTSGVYIFFMIFLIGFIHSFFPGSGKIYAASYFLSKDLKINEALKYSYKAMFIHTAVTFIMYNLIMFGRVSDILKLSFFDFFNPYGRYMLVISSSLLFILGLFLFFNRLGFALSRTSLPVVDKTPGSLYLLMIFVGISPCVISGHLVEMSYDINLLYALVMILGFILGMSLGMFSFLAVVIAAKRLMLSSLSGSWQTPSPFKTTLEVGVLFFMTIAALSFAIFNIAR